MPRFAKVLGTCLFCAALLWLKGPLEQRTRAFSHTRTSLKPLQASYHGKALRKYSFGFENALADLIWIELLQKASHEKLSKDRVSWEYAELDAITRLDPNFENAYVFGAAYLSVFREDNLGAKLLLERWVKRKGNFWRPNYLLGHHLFFQMHDYPQASKYILRAAQMEGAPAWLPALGIRVLSEAGALAQALNLSLQLFSELDSVEAKTRLRIRIRTLHYYIEKKSWEESLTEYRSLFREEPRSISDLVRYREKRLRELSSVIDGTQISPEIAGLLNERFAFRYERKTKSIVAVASPKDLTQLGIYKPNN